MPCDQCEMYHQINPEGSVCPACGGKDDPPPPSWASVLRLQPDQLAKAVWLVRAARIAAATLAAQLADEMRQFETQHEALITTLAAAREVQRQVEEECRTLALQQFLAGPRTSKQLAPGVSVREKVELSYDPETAFEWAIDGNRLAITPACLNAQVFESLARKYPLEFVTKTVQFQVLLAKTL